MTHRVHREQKHWRSRCSTRPTDDGHGEQDCVLQSRVAIEPKHSDDDDEYACRDTYRCFQRGGRRSILNTTRSSSSAIIAFLAPATAAFERPRNKNACRERG
jgi:hypothetical protein